METTGQSKHDENGQRSENILHVLKEAQTDALKLLSQLLLREIDALIDLEEKIDKGISGMSINLHEEMQHFEASLIRSALIRSGGVQRRAAKILGVKVTTLNIKIKRYKIDLTDVNFFDSVN